MYDVPEPRDWLEPPEGETIGSCAECGQDIFAGEDIWQIKDDQYCEYCISSFRTEAEREDYCEEVI